MKEVNMTGRFICIEAISHVNSLDGMRKVIIAREHDRNMVDDFIILHHGEVDGFFIRYSDEESIYGGLRVDEIRSIAHSCLKHVCPL